MPTALCVVALIALLLYAGSRLTPSGQRASTTPEPITALWPAPALSPATTPPATVPSIATTDPAKGLIPPERRPATTARPTHAATRAPSHVPDRTPSPTTSVTGRFQVLNSYDDAFIGEVLVANSSGTDQDWTVVLRFPDNVGELYTSWVEGAPQATLTSSGRTYTWRSGVPVGAHSSVPLRFHFARTGTGQDPSRCTTNGTACR